MRRLMLLRHATTEAFRPGAPDHARRLTPHGEQEAAAVGEHLRDTPLDLVLCSPATRARQTAAGLGVTAPVEIRDDLYEAGADDVTALVRGLGADVGHVLLVGHAPGLPSAVHDLADRATSDAEALAAVERRFPPATLATLVVPTAWAELQQAALVSVRLP
jgi:phosphohistidine phosphatase